MRIVSWNINSLRKRQDRLFAWLEATGPDVVCLQETKCTDDQFPALALQAAGYYAAYHGEKSVQRRRDSVENRAARCASVSLRRSGRSTGARDRSNRRSPPCFFDLCAERPGSRFPAYEYKLDWYRRLRDCIAKEKSSDVVVCGDFNVAPEDIDVYDADLWRGAIMCSDGERPRFSAIV